MVENPLTAGGHGYGAFNMWWAVVAETGIPQSFQLVGRERPRVGGYYLLTCSHILDYPRESNYEYW